MNLENKQTYPKNNVPLGIRWPVSEAKLLTMSAEEIEVLLRESSDDEVAKRADMDYLIRSVAPELRSLLVDMFLRNLVGYQWGEMLRSALRTARENENNFNPSAD